MMNFLIYIFVAIVSFLFAREYGTLNAIKVIFIIFCITYTFKSVQCNSIFPWEWTGKNKSE